GCAARRDDSGSRCGRGGVDVVVLLVEVVLIVLRVVLVVVDEAQPHQRRAKHRHDVLPMLPRVPGSITRGLHTQFAHATWAPPEPAPALGAKPTVAVGPEAAPPGETGSRASRGRPDAEHRGPD